MIQAFFVWFTYIWTVPYFTNFILPLFIVVLAFGLVGSLFCLRAR